MKGSVRAAAIAEKVAAATPKVCFICSDAGPNAEMFDPRDPNKGSHLVHDECGLAAGWEIA